MPKGSTRTRGSASGARKAGPSGTPRRASTTSPVSEPKWLTARGTKAGRKAKGGNRTWVSRLNSADRLQEEPFYKFELKVSVEGVFNVLRQILTFPLVFPRNALENLFAGRWRLARRRIHHQCLPFTLTRRQPGEPERLVAWSFCNTLGSLRLEPSSGRTKEAFEGHIWWRTAPPPHFPFWNGKSKSG